ncbi:hypothetical protein CRM22_008696 [Opisthorchis felineus]|uniref:G-protein coupled receptors family 1 profile domain-containing protein n=1 Tax=Opisthorchis felineus TaxID=147828 RepID=A0A4S2LA37_OPIFE|nr:hypothetical protein CRM22_008696 [Opisthorchis felineus]
MGDDFTPADYVATLTMLGIVSVLGTLGNLLVVGVYLQHLLWPHLQRYSLKGYEINYSERQCATLTANYDDTTLTDHFCARQMTTPTFFILVLAIVDLIVCCFVVPLAFYLEFVELKASSELWCKLHAFGSVCNTMFSSLLVIAIALDRYFAICHPLKNVLTMRRAKILTAALAIFCCVYGILSQDMMELAVGKFSNDNVPRCHDAIELENITSTKVYFYHIIQKGNSSCFVLSILVVLILYSLILRAALKAQRRIRNNALWREIRAAIVLFVVAVVYIIVFAPSLLSANQLIPGTLFGYNSYYLNNMSNPLIYCFMSQAFRRRLKVLLCSSCINPVQSQDDAMFSRSGRRERIRRLMSTVEDG